MLTELEIKLDIREFHYLCLPILNPELEEKEHFNVPDFHWDLYDGFYEDCRLQLTVAPVGFAKSTELRIFGVKEVLDKNESFILYVSSPYDKAVDQFGGIKKILNEKAIQLIYKYKIIKTNEAEIAFTFVS